MTIKQIKKKSVSPVYLAIGAALLFGASTPACKLLIGQINPQLLAGVLYLGSGLSLTLYNFAARRFPGIETETPLQPADFPWLAGAIIFGGIMAPLLLMIGLRSTSGADASLLLNLEAVFTALLAWFVFKENFDRRVMIGMVAIVIGGCLLSWVPGASFTISIGAVAIVAACFCWALDNNLTSNISGSDPLEIAAAKGLVAGTVNFGLALALGNKLPTLPILTIGALTGVIGYGISLSLYIKALRHLGTARSGAYFATAPFAGALLSLVILKDPLTINFVTAAIFMGLGVWLHLTETHVHEHTHEVVLHEHLHIHDQDHQHEHSRSDPAGEPHSHLHMHPKITHTHAHFPDIDHRHEH